MTQQEFTTLTGLPADKYTEDQFEIINAMYMYSADNMSKKEFCQWFVNTLNKNLPMFNMMWSMGAAIVTIGEEACRLRSLVGQKKDEIRQQRDEYELKLKKTNEKYFAASMRVRELEDEKVK